LNKLLSISLTILNILLISCDANLIHEGLDANPCNHSSHMDNIEYELLFNGNINNSGARSSLGIINNTSWETDRFGNHNSAIGFNGTDSYIEHGVFSNFNTNLYMICFWLKVPVQGNMTSVVISNYDSDSIDINYMMDIGFFSGYKLTCRTSYDGTQYSIESSKDMNDDTWHFIAFVVQHESNCQYLYIDGNLDKTLQITEFNGSADGILRIGAHRHNNNIEQFYKGIVDDIRFYTGVFDIEYIVNKSHHEGCWQE
jgi:hypothetical protein